MILMFCHSIFIQCSDIHIYWNKNSFVHVEERQQGQKLVLSDALAVQSQGL